MLQLHQALDGKDQDFYWQMRQQLRLKEIETQKHRQRGLRIQLAVDRLPLAN
jgi:hypothetical protein